MGHTVMVRTFVFFRRPRSEPAERAVFRSGFHPGQVCDVDQDDDRTEAARDQDEAPRDETRFEVIPWLARLPVRKNRESNRGCQEAERQDPVEHAVLCRWREWAGQVATARVSPCGVLAQNAGAWKMP